MDKAKFEEQIKSTRKKTIQPVVLLTLKKMLDMNVRFFDTHYIQARSLELVENSIKKLKFKSDHIEKARRAFLDVLIEGIKIHDWAEERRQLKEELKTKNIEKKKKVKEALKRLDRLEAKQVGNKTDQRDLDCEPICQEVAKKVLSKELLLADDSYISGAIELDNELLISINAMNLVSALFEEVYNSLDESYLRANEKLWGVPRTEIKMKQLDNTLKT